MEKEIAYSIIEKAVILYKKSQPLESEWKINDAWDTIVSHPAKTFIGGTAFGLLIGIFMSAVYIAQKFL